MLTTMERPAPVAARPRLGELRRGGPSYQAYGALYLGYTALPIIAGLDKFSHLLVDWNQYLAPIVPRVTGIPTGTFMLGVGIVEIAAGILVAVKPRWGGLLVCGWLLGIAANLLMVPGYFDIALRDFGLAVGAFALSRLSAEHRG